LRRRTTGTGRRPDRGDSRRKFNRKARKREGEFLLGSHSTAPSVEVTSRAPPGFYRGRSGSCLRCAPPPGASQTQSPPTFAPSRLPVRFPRPATCGSAEACLLQVSKSGIWRGHAWPSHPEVSENETSSGHACCVAPSRLPVRFPRPATCGSAEACLLQVSKSGIWRGHAWPSRLEVSENET
jgi:hypothetical protein